MRTLLTGSTGFLGSNIKKRFESEGHDVYTINHKHLIGDTSYLSGFLEKLQPDRIIHCAAAGNMYGKHSDDEILRSNIWGLYNLLKLTKNIPYSSFINFSSLSVNLPTLTMYAASKIAGESICKSYVDSYGKPIVSVVPASVYGVGEQSSHLIPTLIRSSFTGEPMSFIPTPVHDYIYIDDLVDAVLLLTNKAYQLKGRYVEVGSGYETSNEDVKKCVERLVGKRADTILSSDIRPYDVRTGWAADTRIMLSLDWTPKTSLVDGLRLMVDDYKRQNKV